MVHELANLIKHAKTATVLTGAGISAESGVPTFRGKEGLWGKFKPEELATMDAFMANPKIVWEWYKWRRDIMTSVKPNDGHYALVELARWFKQLTIVTQNVDGLHKTAGSKQVLEIHGNIYRNKCSECNQQVAEDLEINPMSIPVCPKCGGRIRPDVVWFGEMLPEDVIKEAFEVSEHADIFFSIGTSALVHPAASLPLVARKCGSVLVEINPDETPLTPLVDYHFPCKSGELLPKLVQELQRIE